VTPAKIKLRGFQKSTLIMFFFPASLAAIFSKFHFSCKSENVFDGILKFFEKRDRETERQRDRETERQRDRETERQKDRKTKGQRDREIDRQRDREKENVYYTIITREKEDYRK